eukprot:364050-Chlamydomonas_euryale.AAC.3
MGQRTRLPTLGQEPMRARRPATRSTIRHGEARRGDAVDSMSHWGGGARGAARSCGCGDRLGR